jgi:hypothetical protein
MTTYTTAQIDVVVSRLEADLGKGYSKVAFEGRTTEYKTNADIRDALAYWKGLYATAIDAPASPPAKIRNYYFHGNKGFTSSGNGF